MIITQVAARIYHVSVATINGVLSAIGSHDQIVQIGI